MAEFESTYNLIVSSGDISAVGDAAQWTVPLMLETPGEWTLRVVNLSFPNPGVADNSVFLYTDIVDATTTRIGSQLSTVIHRTRPIALAEPSPVYIENVQPLPVWFPLKPRNSIQSVTMTIQDSAGNNPPIGPGQFSTVQIQLRRTA